MVEGLTGERCTLKYGEDCYFFEVDYSAHKNDVDYLAAVWAAIEGRIGGRLIEMQDIPERTAFMVRVAFSDNAVPGLARVEGPGIPAPEAGRKYCRQLAEVRALQVGPDNEKPLRRFVGNGYMDKDGAGRCVFHFLNAGGAVWADAPEGWYILYLEGARMFTIMAGKDFETQYEAKAE